MNSEKQIVNALKSKDEMEVNLALGYLYNNYCRLVYICILSLVKDKRDAEELTDDTFIKLYQNRYNIYGSDSIKYYIVTIAKHIALDFLKRKHLEIVLNDDYVFNCVEAKESDEIIELRNRLGLYLSDDDVDIVIEHIVFGCKFQDIALFYDIPVNTVKTRYFRALKKIKTEMRGIYEQS